MKASAWRKVAREHLMPYLPGFQLAGTLLVFGQVEWILHAVTVDTSAFSDTRIAVWMISQPLYVPSEGTRGDYGERLRQRKNNFEWWDMEPGKEALVLGDIVRIINERALPFYARTATPGGLATYSEERYRRSVNPPNIEVEAYSWALAGEDKKALEALERLKRAVDAMPPRQTWGQQILERSLFVHQALEEGPQAVVQVLGQWRDESVHRLKLDKLAQV